MRGVGFIFLMLILGLVRLSKVLKYSERRGGCGGGWRNPVYCSWSTKNTPLNPLFLFFPYFQAHFSLGLCLPHMVRKEVQLGPRRIKAPRIRKKRKRKNKEGSKSKPRESPGGIISGRQRGHLAEKILKILKC